MVLHGQVMYITRINLSPLRAMMLLSPVTKASSARSGMSCVARRPRRMHALAVQVHRATALLSSRLKLKTMTVPSPLSASDFSALSV